MGKLQNVSERGKTMPYRERVIKGLECLITSEVPCDGCPYNEGENSSCLKNIAKDALELLKEQEPVEPSVDVDTYVCPNCGHRLEHQGKLGDNVIFDERYNFCPECGKAVKWDG